MRKSTSQYWKYLTLSIVGLVILSGYGLMAKDNARLSVDYFHIMNQEAYIAIEAKYKIEKKYVPAQNLNLNIYFQFTEDSLQLIGSCQTEQNGFAKFKLPIIRQGEIDSVIEYAYIVRIEDSDQFNDASKSVTFYQSYLDSRIIEEDSIYYLIGELVDAKNLPVEGVKLQVQVQRLFAPLKIGRSIKTDENGMVKVEIADPLPGPNGVLIFEVVCDNKKYGNLKIEIEASIGKEIVDLSTYDKRTMWSSRDKTPLFLLIFPNMIILGIWICIFILVKNIYTISKS
jgi:hypothetical protein